MNSDFISPFKFSSLEKFYDCIIKFLFFFRITPKTKKRCRDQVRRVVLEYGLSWQEVWVPKRDKYEFNGYDDMSEEIAQKVIKELEEE